MGGEQVYILKGGKYVKFATKNILRCLTFCAEEGQKRRTKRGDERRGETEERKGVKRRKK